SESYSGSVVARVLAARFPKVFRAYKQARQHTPVRLPSPHAQDATLHCRPCFALAKNQSIKALASSAASFSPRRLLKNPRMSRYCKFSEDRQEPTAGRSRSATDTLGDTARAENWRNPEGASSLGPSLGVAPQSQPRQGMLLRRSTDI